MKISSITSNSYNLQFLAQPAKDVAKPNVSLKKGLLYAGGVAVTLAGITAFIKYRKKNVLDFDFKKELVKSLQAEGISVSPNALDSVVGPQKFKELVSKFKPSQFRAGLQTSKSNIPLEEFYANSINGDFRVSLHTHSNFSDGKATPEEFIECARKYADKVAKLKKKDDLPPFTIALTDHDNVDGTKEIIKLIAKNPEKYKNLKFVAGCEFSVKNGDKHHDITGLALNPFEKNLNDMLQKLRTNRQNTIQEFLNSKQTSITLEDLKNYEKDYYNSKGKSGKRTMENASGVVYIRHAIKYYYKLIGKPVDNSELNRLDAKDILPIEEVVNTINQNGGYASLTHPLKSFWGYIGDEALAKLKNLGVKGIEVNHQYTPSKIKSFGEKSGYGAKKADVALKEINAKYEKFAKENDMFLSGGTDCHEKQIFSREPKISEDFLNEKILK